MAHDDVQTTLCHDCDLEIDLLSDQTHVDEWKDPSGEWLTIYRCQICYDHFLYAGD